MARTLFIGTTNPGKLGEFVALLGPLGLTVKVARSADEVEEPSTDLLDGFAENARIKALAYARISGGVTLAEDSGLAVAALGGLPGIYSARFADVDLAAKKVLKDSCRPREVMDPLNNQRLLECMKGFEQPRRAALFRTAAVLATASARAGRGAEVLFSATAESHGWIAQEARGDRGFGYDPVFVGQDTFGKTYAEIDPVRKNLKSHRKRVMDELFFWLSKHTDVFDR
ncbi:MAG TPA: non-canonical purine NTP pyrophosphatase [Myxococcales bacterium]|jgi:XTP/dITP diphosphohydrolase